MAPSPLDYPFTINTPSTPPVPVPPRTEMDLDLEEQELQIKLRLIELQRIRLSGGGLNTRPGHVANSHQDSLGTRGTESPYLTYQHQDRDFQIRASRTISPVRSNMSSIVTDQGNTEMRSLPALNDMTKAPRGSESTGDMIEPDRTSVPLASSVSERSLESNFFSCGHSQQKEESDDAPLHTYKIETAHGVKPLRSEPELEKFLSRDDKCKEQREVPAEKSKHDVDPRHSLTTGYPKPIADNTATHKLQSSPVDAYVAETQSCDDQRHLVQEHGSAKLSQPCVSVSHITQNLLSVAQNSEGQMTKDDAPASPSLPSQLDLQAAQEIAEAEEEAIKVFQMGDSHPILQQQLGIAVSTHMSNQSPTVALSRDAFQQVENHEAQGVSTLPDDHQHKDSTTSKKQSKFTSWISGQYNTSQAERRKNEPGGLAEDAVEASDKESQTSLEGATKIESDRFSGKADNMFSQAQDEDTCQCGKGKLATDECYFCWPCDGTIFCADCWSKCPPHKKRKFGASHTTGLPHEKSDPAMARKIFETLQADHSIENQALLHVQDEDTSWFGTNQDEATGEIVFQDFGRYSRLIAENSARHRRIRYPALVSFVGQTGAGKSSLIRLLIQSYAPEQLRPQVPVVGSMLHNDLPTSGDVHLYADPKTLDGTQPILYADCEGLDGGARQPMGARSRNKDVKSATPNERTQSFTTHLRKQHHTSEREILWATTTQTRSRDYHVRHLYPRLLYTFSDVIVFVMKNPRVIENTIEQLLKWADAALETSSNQPVLPHAVIVLNAYDNFSEASLWDVDKSTMDLMDKVGRAVHQNHSIRKFAEFWRLRGKSIESVQSLLLSYYSSVRVVRVVGAPPFVRV